MLNQPKSYNPYDDPDFVNFCDNECDYRFDSEAPFGCLCPFIEQDEIEENGYEEDEE